MAHKTTPGSGEVTSHLLRQGSKAFRNVLPDIAGALRFILTRKEIASVTAIAAGVSFAGGAFLGLAAVYAGSVHSPVRRPVTLGVLTSCLAAGSLIASVLGA